jgi:hypothetical protein
MSAKRKIKPPAVGPLPDMREEQFARTRALFGKSKHEAALAAGYAAPYASSQGSRLANRPRVRARIEALNAAVAEEAIAQVAKVADMQIASKQARVRMYNDIMRRLMMIADERAADPTMAKVPGGTGGFVLRRIKGIRGGKFVAEYVSDTALAQELRAVAQQAAEELGQWKDEIDEGVLAPKAAFPDWLTDEWKERGSTNPSGASENSTPSESNTKDIRVQ